MKQTTPTSRRSLRPSRIAVGAGAIAAGVAMLLSPLGAGAQSTDVSANAGSSVISVTTVPSGVTGECVPAATAMAANAIQVYPVSDATTFVLKVVVTAPLCEAITGSAVVYKMPANGEQWPQQLAEQIAVSFKDPGTTTITFTKGCDRVQYDLVTGAPPAVLNTGFDHQLLFPGNLETAFQHVGNAPDCVQPSTTVAPTTTVAVTTTTARVAGSTTIATTTIVPRVLAESETPSSGTAANNAGLAATGSSTSSSFALMGGGLVLIGVASLLASRRRTV